MERAYPACCDLTCVCPLGCLNLAFGHFRLAQLGYRGEEATSSEWVAASNFEWAVSWHL